MCINSLALIYADLYISDKRVQNKIENKYVLFGGVWQSFN